jgi:hypothetical protein
MVYQREEMMIKPRRAWMVFLMVSPLGPGCGPGGSPQGPSAPGSAAPAEVSRFLLPQEPAGALGVIEVRAESRDGDSVVVVGRVGGSAEPLVKGRAAFTIVDPSVKTCTEKCNEDAPTPWDFS